MRSRGRARARAVAALALALAVAGGAACGGTKAGAGAGAQPDAGAGTPPGDDAGAPAATDDAAAPADGAGAAAGTDAGAGADAETTWVAGIPAFPGAEGFGRFAKGGRGGSVCHVTTLADAGAGSLRDCVSASNRTVVFDVGGWITLASNLAIAGSNLTIAGQTAPGGGVGVRGKRVSISGRGVVVRFMRFRRGTIVDQVLDDSLVVTSSADSVIIDHCSVGFGIDQNLSIPGDDPAGPHDLTVQWTINGFALQVANHSAGALLTANDTTIHHTLWALNKTRNPQARTTAAGVLDWVNNVVYGWDAHDPQGQAVAGSDPFMLGGAAAGGMHRANAVGNMFISIYPAQFAFDAGTAAADGTPAFSLYFDSNFLDGNGNGGLDVSKQDWTMVEAPAAELTDRLTAPPVMTDDPITGCERVLTFAGATVPQRDQVDALLVSDVRYQSGALITTEADLVAAGVGNGGFGTLEPGTPPADADRDGMPDAWETAHGLDPADPTDGNGDPDGDGYTNIEDYLTSLVPPSSI